jgi:hypothetical protein
MKGKPKDGRFHIPTKKAEVKAEAQELRRQPFILFSVEYFLPPQAARRVVHGLRERFHRAGAVLPETTWDFGKGPLFIEILSFRATYF